MRGEEETLQYLVDIMQELNLAKIDSYTEHWNTGKQSFSEVVWGLIEGDDFSFTGAMQEILQIFLREIEKSSNMLAAILLIAVGYFLISKAMPDNRKHLSEAAYYTCYSGLILVVLDAFLDLSRVTAAGVTLLLQYLKVLIPTFATTIALTGKLSSAAVFYELTFGLIWVCEWVIADFIMPAIHIYVVLSLISHMDGSDSLGGYVSLLESGIRMVIKGITGGVIGLGCVQSLLSMARDQITQNSVLKAFAVLPGVGNGVEFAQQVLLSCGCLVKNCVGVAGMIFLILAGMGPILTLLAGYVGFRFASAALGTLWDKGMAKCMEDIAKAVWFLLVILGYAMLWFLLSLLMVMAATGGG